jgi:hypothetical protein
MDALWNWWNADIVCTARVIWHDDCCLPRLDAGAFGAENEGGDVLIILLVTMLEGSCRW